MTGGRVFLVAVCCLALALGSDAQGRHMLQQPAVARAGSKSSSKKGSSASASTSAISNGGVSASYARADSAVLEEVSSSVIHIVSEAHTIAKAGGDAQAAANAAGSAIGYAVAKAYAKTIVKVYVQGDGEACGSADANAQASATAYAAVVAEAIVSATDGTTSADADAYAKSIQIATVDAFAEASSYACTTGGWGTAKQESFAASARAVYARAVANALAKVSDGHATADSSSLADGKNIELIAPTTESTTTTDAVSLGGKTVATADGTAAASGFQVLECQREVGICCFETDQATCNCGPDCNYYKRDTQEGIVTWYPEDDSKHEPCYCAGGFFG